MKLVWLLYALGLCTKLLLDLQARIEELYSQQQLSICYVSHVLGSMQGE